MNSPARHARQPKKTSRPRLSVAPTFARSELETRARHLCALRKRAEHLCPGMEGAVLRAALVIDAAALAATVSLKQLRRVTITPADVKAVWLTLRPGAGVERRSDRAADRLTPAKRVRAWRVRHAVEAVYFELYGINPRPGLPPVRITEIDNPSTQEGLR